MKAVGDNKINVTNKLKFAFGWEDILETGENSGHQYLQCCLKAWSDRQTDLLRMENGQNIQNLVIR